jgi:CRP-like cAMP-binding protein/Fe-S-cluster-containing hydrogenase component 2
MQQVLEQYLAKVPLFHGADHYEIFKLLKEYRVQEYNPGEYICRQGEYNEDCGIILDGSVHVLVPVPGTKIPKKFPLPPGEIFGEIAAMTGTPRTADVAADSTAHILKISRERLFKIMDNFPVVKQRLDAKYIERALSTHLASINIFSGLSKSFLDELKDKVVLKTFNKDAVIFNQGDPADAFYLIRYGFVKVAVSDGKGGEKVISYLNEGSYFGEIALLSNEKRSATISALNRVEIIKIAKADFEEILAHQPAVKTALEKISQQRLDRTTQVSSNAALSQAISAAVNQGVIQSKAVLIMDISKCVHCDNCVKACAALHDGQSRLIRKGIKFSDFIFLPTSCRNCQDPVCMTKCPTGAIKRDLSGEIYHQDHCIGCGSCARLCPFGNISIVVINERVEKVGLMNRILSAFRGRLKAQANGGSAENGAKAGDRTKFPGEKMMVEREDSAKLPGERDMFTTAESPAGGQKKKAAKVRKKAVKCDMCRDYDFMGCIYNCPTGATRRVDPTEYFFDLKSAG